MSSRCKSRSVFQHAGWLVAMLALAATAHAPAGEPPMFDLSKDKVLYCVGYAHLDTQWRWDFCTTIDKYIRDTLEQNFALFDKHPGYVFNFTGSVRYEMMREYYPELYAKLKEHIAAGRWFVSGSSVDEGDVNVPSAEAVIRQVLYGNQFFRREFGKESVDFMLPDCFGFPAAMPSIWAHCGLKGFSTQKLTWGSAMGIPFKIGVWEGLDGQSIIAALDPGPYVGAVKGRVDTNPDWVKRVNTNGERFGVFADYHYYGVGDQGGAPHEKDVVNYLASIDQPDSQIRVALVSSDQMYKDITPEMQAKLPRYKGDLLLTEHSAGTLTSQSYMKRWNRKNEQLADAAERAAVAAHWLGGAAYPREKLYRSWVRALANQMHDILPGTSIPRAYTYSWNDEIIALNGFAAVLTDSVGAIARALDTRVEGSPLVVYNPLAIEREDVVEATIPFLGPAPRAVRIFDPHGAEAPSQIVERSDRALRVLFLARAAPLSWTVFDARPAEAACDVQTGLTIDSGRLENRFVRVHVNPAGDVGSIVDKANGDRELLARNAQLVFTHERPKNWPAWNMDWADRQRPPLGVVDGPAKITITERGPVRVALRVERAARGSIVVQDIQLSAGDAGKRVEFQTEIDWQSAECALRASFPLRVANPKATYNWEIGTIERGNNEPVKYEVPSHQWLDLTDASGDLGVSILEDSKYGSDKPADDEVRLTLLYTPGVRDSYQDQHSQDWGRHEMLYAVYSHAGDWRTGQSEWQARRLNQPLRAFLVTPHAGPLGKSFGLARVSTPQVDLRALKLDEEDDDRVIVRVQELWGRAAQGVEVAFSTPILDAYEVDGQERRIGPVAVNDGKLAFDLGAFRPATFSVKLGPPPTEFTPATQAPVALAFDADVVSRDAGRADGRFDAEGRTIPAEQLPELIVSEGIAFRLAGHADGQPNALTCRGQEIALPEGDFDHLYLLAAATEDTTGTFAIGDTTRDLTVQSWTGFIGQWYDRVFDQPHGENDHVCAGRVIDLKPAYIKRDTVAWFCTHRHHPQKGNEAYHFSYLFKYALPFKPGTRTLTLPDNERIHIFAITAAHNPNEAVRALRPLYDDFSGWPPVTLRYQYPPPPRPAHEGLTPTAVFVAERQPAFDKLQIGAPVATDCADASHGQGVAFGYFEGDGEFAPHPRAGAKDGRLPRLNDGQAAENDDDTRRCVWYDNEGRFFVDLQRSVPIARVNTYSWHRSNRAPQHFSLWASNAEQMPPAAISQGRSASWTLLAVVDTRKLGDGGVHGTAVQAADGRVLGPYRHLLWIAENMGQGTFFTEIDVHAQP